MTSTKKAVKANKTEILIIRNAIFRQQYDVVEVDFLNENILTIDSGLTFEEAVALKENLRPEAEEVNERDTDDLEEIEGLFK